MFHVKHPGKSSVQARQPDRIARALVAQVEETLRNLRFDPGLPDFLFKIDRFAAALALWGGKTNLTAAPNDPVEVAFHIVDSLAPLLVARSPGGAMLRDAFGTGRRVLDLGSGAGFPGLVLAAATAAHFTLLEARHKRASFLTVTAAEMGLSNVEVDVRQREPQQLTPGFDVATGRAFAQPAIFYRTASAALRPGGCAILYANPDQELKIEAAAASGLSEVERIGYVVQRGDLKVERILAVWRKRDA